MIEVNSVAKIFHPRYESRNGPKIGHTWTNNLGFFCGLVLVIFHHNYRILHQNKKRKLSFLKNETSSDLPEITIRYCPANYLSYCCCG